MKIVFGALLGFLIASLTEYLLHRFYLHRDVDNEHIKHHHKIYSSQLHFVVDGTMYKDVASSWRYIWLTILLGMPLGVVFWYFSFLNLITFFCVSVVYAYGLEVFHVAIHSGYQGMISRTELYSKVMDNHYIHHKVYDKNYGIGSYHWDILFRTKSEEKFFCKKNRGGQ